MTHFAFILRSLLFRESQGYKYKYSLKAYGGLRSCTLITFSFNSMIKLYNLTPTWTYPSTEILTVLRLHDQLIIKSKPFFAKRPFYLTDLEIQSINDQLNKI